MAAPYQYAPPSVSRLVVAWLMPLSGDGSAALRRPANAPLPFRLVAAVAGTETENKIRQVAVVSVHTFAATMDAAEAAAQITHQRMLSLGPPNTANQQVTVTNADGSTTVVTPDYVTTAQIPIWVDYQDEDIFRFVARYNVATRFVRNA